MSDYFFKMNEKYAATLAHSDNWGYKIYTCEEMIQLDYYNNIYEGESSDAYVTFPIDCAKQICDVIMKIVNNMEE